ncbi:hypothetical protein CPB84DRAFT_1180128 [Gymnopilus junonius]|uniref:F-box domain-containing protein n=1 Tax=Gymnopilus junonius TaxID=109634 RepID=A0A9P5TMA3_GYMJU|nr:hypothetical protein CPB84DRAFT_1180128 [Gymnopilus junonius]
MTSTHLPQEIIDLIIDEVACHGSRATLKTCSVVSMAFYLASRKHLFSDISFLVDTSCQTRAAELIKVLQNNDAYLIPAIRSLNLKFDMAGLPPPAHSSSRGILYNKFSGNWVWKRIICLNCSTF